MANNITVGILRALLTLDTAQFESGLRQAGMSSKAFQSQMRGIGRGLTDVGSTLTAAVTLPIVAAFGGAAKAAIDFESSFAGVRKTVNASEAEFAVMSQQFRDLSKQIPVNVNDLNRLGEAAGALGIPKEEIVGFAKVMAELGVTTNVTAEQAADSIAKIQNIFGASGKNTEQFASTLVDLGNKGASTEAEILALATRIASAGNTVNMTQAQVLGFSSAIANVGMEAEAGGSAFSRVVLKMSQAVSAGGAKLNEFAQIAGMTGKQFAELFRNDAAAATVKFVEGLGRIKQSGGDLNAVLTDLGFKEIRQSDLLRRLAGASDMVGQSLTTASTAWKQNTALTEEARKRFETTTSQLTLLWNKVTDLGITIGNAFLPMIKAAIAAFDVMYPLISGIANAFAAMPIPIQAAAIGFGLVVAAVGPLLMIFGQLAFAAASLSAAFTTGGIGMTAMTTAANLQAAAMARLSTIYTTMFGPGMAFLNAAWVRLTTFITTNTVAVYANAAADKIATTTKALFSGALVMLQTAASGAAARLGLTTLATNAQAVASRIAAVATGIFGTALSTLGVVAAVAASAFVGWQLGRWIGETTGATDGVGKLSAKIGEMVGLLPKGTAAQYDASRAAAKYNEANQATAAASKQAADSVKQIEAAMAQAMKTTPGLTGQLSQARMELAGLTAEQRETIASGIAMGKSIKDIAAAAGVSKEVIKLYKTEVAGAKRESKEAAKETEAWNKAVTDVLKTMHSLAIDNAADVMKGARDKAEQGADQMLASFNRRIEAERDAATISQDIEFQRAEFAIEQAKRNGASWQQIYAMEKALADARLQRTIDQAQLEFEVRTAWIDRTTAHGEAEYQALKTAHDLKIQGMVEAHQQAETLKREELVRTHNVWIQTINSAKELAASLTSRIADGFVSMLTEAKSFKQAFVGVWQSIKQSILDIFSNLLHAFVTSFLNGIVSAMTGRQGGFAGAFSNMFGGLFGGGGGGVGGLFGTGGNIAMSLFGGGGGAAGALGSGAAMNATIDSLAAGGAGAGGAGGAGMGFLANPAFWTNPFTIAGIAGAALGLGIWRGGLFRGGEEALKVSPRRDKFFSQFGDVQNRGTGGAAWNLANKLVGLGQGEGGGPLFAALQQADTVKEWESAQAAVVALLHRAGMEVHSFAKGGFIPPGVVTPAVLHGGTSGEIIAPLDKMPGLAMTVNWTVNALDASGVRTAMPALIRELKMAMLLNQDGLMTAQRRAMEA